MLWIVAIAFLLALLRSKLGPTLLVFLVPGIAIVVGLWLTALTIERLNRRLIRTRKEPVSEIRHWGEMVLLMTVVLLGISFTLALGMTIVVGMVLAVSWLRGNGS
jgi:hypothetical protein